MYSLLIHLYALAARLASPFHKKARLMCEGQKQTNPVLRSLIRKDEKYIWFHAASLGEFEQGRPMMEQVKAHYPQYKILLTFFSPSGYEVRKNYQGADVICYLPFDTPRRVEQFLDLANPVAAVFIKYEFWGNYLGELKRRDIPVFIISAIFRPGQSFFKWYGASYRRLLHAFNHLYVQDEPSKALLAKYGITNVTVAGDTRFDRVQDIRDAAKEVPLVDALARDEKGNKQLTLVVGSSWPQHEQFLLPFFNGHKEMKMVIAPHEIHEEHLAAIEKALERPCKRLSTVRSAEDLKGVDCLIIDCFGLLSSIYRYGEIAYVGGGFGAGIHNTLEAAVYGVPVLFGPKYGKFKEAKDLVEVGGAFPVNSGEEFAACMKRLMTDAKALHDAGEASGNYVSRQVGATDKILPEIMKDIPS